MARRAFRRAKEPDALQLELLPDQLGQLRAASNNVSPVARWRPAAQSQFQTQRLVDLHGEKRDLAFVILFIVEKPVPANAPPGDALDFRRFHRRKISRRLFVMPEEIVPRRNI